ncbi:unnamed protein product [Triticum turgidum subsp. durum]|uniref:LRAT domain-containing protein n=1 Tax=Triticum turgidum subsp. durum TaxID=4567 RepID=A0A9R0TU47_TRITD|nr:unnamed protein product [Triticum turgidum subsp. durum]
MGLLSNRVERSEVRPGDHIYTWRAVYAYSHHGIYVGGSKVVHFTRKKEVESSDSSNSISGLISQASSECPTFPDCGFQLADSGVVLTCLDCFLGNGSLYCFEYGVPPAIFLAKFRGGTCTIAQSDPSEVVVRRAMHLLQNGFGNYDMFEKNCEDFALYCKTGLVPVDEPGIGVSGQASSAIGVPLAALLSTPFKIFAAGPLGMATVTAGMYCAGRYITDIGVRKDVAKVEVENLSSHLGFRRVEDAESVNRSSDKVKKLLPLKRKRESLFKNGCKFWYWEEEYTDILIERNLVHVHALLASIEAINETSALVARLEARHKTRCEEEATSTSGLKKKGGCQIEPSGLKKKGGCQIDPPPQINNECIEKALTQLKGAVIEVGYLLKCILVVLLFFGLALLVKM